MLLVVVLFLIVSFPVASRMRIFFGPLRAKDDHDHDLATLKTRLAPRLELLGWSSPFPELDSPAGLAKPTTRKNATNWTLTKSAADAGFVVGVWLPAQQQQPINQSINYPINRPTNQCLSCLIQSSQSSLTMGGITQVPIDTPDSSTAPMCLCIFFSHVSERAGTSRMDRHGLAFRQVVLAAHSFNATKCPVSSFFGLVVIAVQYSSQQAALQDILAFPHTERIQQKSDPDDAVP